MKREDSVAREFVKQLLPEAYAYESDCGGGWCVDSVFPPLGETVPHLVYGKRDEATAWRKAAAILGWRRGQ